MNLPLSSRAWFRIFGMDTYRSFWRTSFSTFKCPSMNLFSNASTCWTSLLNRKTIIKVCLFLNRKSTKEILTKFARLLVRKWTCARPWSLRSCCEETTKQNGQKETSSRPRALHLARGHCRLIDACPPSKRSMKMKILRRRGINLDAPNLPEQVSHI